MGLEVPADACASGGAENGSGPVDEPADVLGGMEALGRDECLGLLARAPVGRVAVTSGALPLVLPISFRLVHDRIFFRVVRGSILDTATRNTVVAFEADEVDPATLFGWSVVVVGVAEDALESECPAALAAAGVPWARPRSDHRLVVLSTDVVSGRRIVFGPPPVDAAV